VTRAAWVLVALGGVAAEAVGFGLNDPGGWVPDLLTGWLLAGCGLVAWERRRASLTGPLLVATAVLWFAGDVSSALVFAYRAPLVALVLTYPGGRPRGRAQTIAVAAAWVAAAIPAVWRSEPLAIALGVAAVVVAGLHRRAAAGRERRERTAALRATTAFACLLAGTAVMRLAVTTPAITDNSLAVFELGVCVIAVALVAGLLREPWARVRATDLVIELADARSGAVRDALARALGDPTLELAFALGDGYVDAAGHALTLPVAGSARRTTTIIRDGAPVAALIHDQAVLDDPGLDAALSEAAHLAATNARLQAEVRQQISELQASRRRLLVVADDERRRLEQRLRDTAQQRLTRLLPELAAARCETTGDSARAARITRVTEQLERSLDDLGRLAAGLHPHELEALGLDGALHALAGRSPVPVDLAVSLPEELPADCERAVYFVCSEALANVAKYARASRAYVIVQAVGGLLRVEVADDGRGGADPEAGSGLRGLGDRVETLGGTLNVDSQPGAGTRIVVELPA
jgi:signal transduction histidine kinase